MGRNCEPQYIQGVRSSVIYFTGLVGLEFYWFKCNATLVRGRGKYFENPVSQIYNFFVMLNELNGVQRIGTHIRSVKRYFRGTNFVLSTNEMVFGSWESAWRHAFVPFSFRYAHRCWECAYVGYLDSFRSLHNFTFSFPAAEYQKDKDRPRKETIIAMGFTFPVTDLFAETYMCPLSFYGFQDYRVFYFSKATPSDLSTLTSLNAPFSDTVATTILLVIWCGMKITLLLLKGKFWDLTESILLTFAGLIVKDLATKGNSRFLLCYTTWLFLVGFVSMTYTNILQSIVVVPGIIHSRPTFEDMVGRNFSFEEVLEKLRRESGSTSHGGKSQ